MNEVICFLYIGVGLFGGVVGRFSSFYFKGVDIVGECLRIYILGDGLNLWYFLIIY